MLLFIHAEPAFPYDIPGLNPQSLDDINTCLISFYIHYATVAEVFIGVLCGTESGSETLERIVEVLLKKMRSQSGTEPVCFTFKKSDAGSITAGERIFFIKIFRGCSLIDGMHAV